MQFASIWKVLKPVLIAGGLVMATKLVEILSSVNVAPV